MLVTMLTVLSALVACDNSVKIDVPVDDCPDPWVYYPDSDGDGLGDGAMPTELCELSEGYVTNGDDPEPDCASNDTDSCGICAGLELDKDCAGECFGEAAIDPCGVCAGGTTGVEPSSGRDTDGDGVADACDQCAPDNMERYIIQYDAIPPYRGNGGPYTFEIVLFENGDVLMQYNAMTPMMGSATAGVQNEDGSMGMSLSQDDTYVLDHPTIFLRRQEGQEFLYSEDYNPQLSWYNVAAVGETRYLSDDDDVTLELPFPFPFYDHTYTRARVSSNGFLYFSDADELPGARNEEMPNNSGAMIAAFWDDLDPGVGGEIYTYHAPGTCVADCANTWGGFAATDDCGECVGGTTGDTWNQAIDCSGVCNGGAAVDECRVCSGGSTGIPVSDPDNCTLLPDFVVDADYLRSTTYIDYVDVAADDCYIVEGCVGGAGRRKVLRFGTMIGNLGTADFNLGSAPGDGFTFNECHQHYHYEDYANYTLMELNGDTAAQGHKNGWCVMDLGIYDPDIVESRCNRHDCENMGISVGCEDTYHSGLDCQWIDITDVEDGDFLLNVTTNPNGNVGELNYENNTAEITVRIEGDEVSVLQ